MPRIINARDYGFRTVITVVLNDADPDAIHEDGQAHRGSPPTGTDPLLLPWEWCHDCRYNWVIREYIWQGDQLTTLDPDGVEIPKGDHQLREELVEMVAADPYFSKPVALSSLEGYTV